MQMHHDNTPREYGGKLYTPIVDTTTPNMRNLSSPSELWTMVRNRTGFVHSASAAFTNAFEDEMIGQLAEDMLYYTKVVGHWCPIPASDINSTLTQRAVLMNAIFPNQPPPRLPPLILFSLVPRASKTWQLILGSKAFLYFTVEAIQALQFELSRRV